MEIYKRLRAQAHRSRTPSKKHLDGSDFGMYSRDKAYRSLLAGHNSQAQWH